MELIHLLAETNTMQWVIYAGVTLVIAYLLLRPSLKKKKDPLERVGPTLGLAQQRSVEREMAKLLVELSDMARQITSQLDTRTAKLEALMDEADQKIAELQRLSSRQFPRPAASTEDPEGRPPMRIERKSAAIDPRHAEIYRLADQGQSSQEIAQQLNRPRGEVELILALRVR